MMSMPAPTIQFDDVLGTPAVDKRLEVLRSMHHAGSISEAARANGVSYKAAWQALETLSNLAGVPLVDKAVGGSGGGGAKLTPAGLQVLEAADLLHSARQQALARVQGDGEAIGAIECDLYPVGPELPERAAGLARALQRLATPLKTLMDRMAARLEDEAEELREEGNALFAKGEYTSACANNQIH
jgi:molybdate transport repressor ModE-like protein